MLATNRSRLRRRLALAACCAILAAVPLALRPAEGREIGGATALDRLAPPPLPEMSVEGYLDRSGARIWYGSVGDGPPVVLLHGGLASSRSWGAQVAPIVRAGYRVVLVDSRGHGRSGLGRERLSYGLMAEDVEAVVAHLGLRRAALVGWSDGAIVALSVGMRARASISGVFAFGANVDQSGVRSDAGEAPILARVGPMLAADYAALSVVPGGFDRLRGEVRAMQAREPRFKVDDLRRIRVRTVVVAGSADDEFVLPGHQAFIARSIPSATQLTFRHGGHFAPWRRTVEFNRALLSFLARWKDRRALD